MALYSWNPHGLLLLESVQCQSNLPEVGICLLPVSWENYGQREKIRTLARYIDYNSVIFSLKWKALWFPNLVTLLAKSEIKRANLLAVYQYINYIHRQLQLPERGRTFSETNATRGMCNQKKKETIMTTVKDWKLWVTLSYYFLLKSLIHANLIKGLWKSCERNESNSDSNVYHMLQY